VEVENIEAKTVRGFAVQTTNKNEMDPSTARISALHQKFDDNVEVDYGNGNRVYGVYFDYESDANGEFSVLAGTDQADIETRDDLETITINAGRYLVFHGSGEMPQTVIETWSKVWQYFSDPSPDYRRAYDTDFEYYAGQNEVKIYIAVE